jgi:hypothetical protein
MQILKPLAMLAIAAMLGLPLGSLSQSHCLHAQTNELPAGLHSILESESESADVSDLFTVTEPAPQATLDQGLDVDARRQPTELTTASEYVETLPAPLPEPLDVSSRNRVNDSLSPVAQASATHSLANPTVDQAATMASATKAVDQPNGAVPDIMSTQTFPRGAAAIGLRGSTTVLVLPGGRIVLAPPGSVPPPMPVGQREALFTSPALSLPPPPPPRFGFRNRLGRR